jgi:hypothetical protein
MKSFWNHAETCWMRDTSGLHFRKQANEIIEKLYTLEDLALFSKLLAAAKAKVSPSSMEYQRIGMIEKEMAPALGRLAVERSLPPRFTSVALFPAPPIDGRHHEYWGNAFIGLGKCNVRVGHDPQNLYFSFGVTGKATDAPPPKAGGRAAGPKPSGVRLLPDEDEEAVLIEIQPDAANVSRRVAILLNRSGETKTAIPGDPAADGLASGNGAHAAVKSDDPGNWSGSVAIPWQSLGIKLMPGMEIRVAISLWEPGKDPLYWSSRPVNQKPTGETAGVISFPEH